MILMQSFVNRTTGSLFHKKIADSIVSTLIRSMELVMLLSTAARNPSIMLAENVRVLRYPHSKLSLIISRYLHRKSR